jgi:hypothetical protein
MELDDFKNIGKNEKAPAMTGEKTTSDNMKTFIEDLKANDAKEQKKIFSFIIIFFVFVTVYFASFNIQKGDMKSGFGILVLGFVLILGFMFWKYMAYKKIDYTAPSTIFLKKASQRYRFMPVSELIISGPLLMILVTGGAIIVYSSFNRYFPGSYIPLIIYFIIMASAVIVGFWSSFKHWKRDKKPILGKIRQMQREFGEPVNW